MTKDELIEAAAAGIAADLPGMRRMRDLMDQAIKQREELLAYYQNQTNATASVTISSSKRNRGGASAWAGLSAEERSTEMKRRIAMRRAANPHPRDADHPDHEKWKTQLSKDRKKAYDKRTPAQKKAWQAAMAAGRARAAAARAKGEAA